MMKNCELLRERQGADPAQVDQEFERHARECPACSAWRDRLQRAEALIQEALRFDVNARGKGEAGTGRAAAGRSTWITLTSGVAAAVLAAVAVWSLFGGGAYLPPEELAAEVADHWFHEPESWVATDTEVSLALLADVLEGEAALNLAAISTVSYAHTCLVGGEWIPHLVVQGEQGPYMVLLMPGRRLESPVPVQLPEQGLAGHILPAGPGSIAVMGGETPELETMESSLVAAVNWSI